jgi:NDP-sugar pyrophosphorylase family protein
MRAIILAGGKGTRLWPYTVTLPKPLVPLGGEMPVVEVLIRQLRQHGVTHITLAVNHLANLIQAFFQDGARWGLRIDYSVEEKPLNTIGPLTMIPDLPENFLVMNGDVLCDLNFAEFYRWHCESDNDVSVSVFRRQQVVDFGVLQYDAAGCITGFREKPTYDFDVSMGVYGFHRRTIQRLKRGESYGFDHLMLDGLKQGIKMRARPFHGYWLDIGRPDDYQVACERFPEIKARLGISS